MKKFVFLLTPLLFFVIAHPVHAQNPFKSGTTVVLPANETINKDYFAAGSTVTVSGIVNGDAYVAGSNVIVDGQINGDLLAAGGNVIIRGSVSQDLRVAGGNVTIDAPVAGNVTVIGGSTTITKIATISGSLVQAVGSTHVSGTVNKDITAAGGEIVLDNPTTGDVNIAVEKVRLTPNAKIGGTFTYVSEKQAWVENGAQISGTVTQKQPPKHEKPAITEKQAKRFISGFTLFLKVIGFFSTLLIGLLLINFFPIFSKRTSQLVITNTFRALGIGLLAMVSLPFILLALFLSIIGIPIGFMVLFGTILLFMFAKIFVIIGVSDRLLRMANQPVSIGWAFFIGLVFYEIVTFIPIIGWLISFITMAVGIGALLIQKHAYYKEMRAENKI